MSSVLSKENEICSSSQRSFVVSNVFNDSSTGSNAVLVVFLSSILGICFLVICLYYLAFRRRFTDDLNDGNLPMSLVKKNSAASMTNKKNDSNVQTATIENENKENGETAPTIAENGNVDPSELRLLQHEDN